jgi:mono/diheme cytochrome c family protein
MKQSGKAIALLLTILISAPISNPAFAAGDGKAEYEKTCIACHASASRLVKKVSGSDSSKKQEFLETFLATHHAPDANIRQAVITYLLSI